MFQTKLRALSRITPDDFALPTVDAKAVIAECVLCSSTDLAFTAIPNMGF
jgi:hypothetical protein